MMLRGVSVPGESWFAILDSEAQGKGRGLWVLCIYDIRRLLRRRRMWIS